MVTLKDGVRIRRFTPALWAILDALRALDRSAPWIPDDLVITEAAATTGHVEGSRHYSDEAIDLRSKNFRTNADKRVFKQLLEQRLGPAFTVLLENQGTANEHFHIQPKKGTTYP